MSAYVVSDEVINGLVNYAVAKKASYYFGNTRTYVDRKNAPAVAQKLIEENYRSVGERYQERAEGYFGKPPKKFKFKFDPAPPYSAVQILKSVACLDYQSCESDDWKETEAFAILDGIKDVAIYALPGYDDAKWGI